jgi:hypothetical protein
MTQNWARKQKPTIGGKKVEGEKVKDLIPQSQEACQKRKGRNTKNNTHIRSTLNSDNNPSQSRCNLHLLQHH